MCASANTRRVTVEIDFSGGGPEGFKVGERSVHQFWHLFSSHFRTVFLAPQRRPDSERVAWTWREPVEKHPVTVAELAEVRRRLSDAKASLAGEFGGLVRDERDASALERQVRAIVAGMTEQLIAHRDAALAAFVCRTDAGLMVHSWGAATAAEPWYPDRPPGEISGTVFLGTTVLAAADVILTTPEGLAAAQTKSDRDGGFLFPGVAPGNYRVKVAGRSDFSDEGMALTMERESITGLELRGMTGEAPIATAALQPPVKPTTPWYRRKATWLALFLIAGVGGGFRLYLQRASVSAAALKNRNLDWQAATGGPAADRTKTSSSGDDRKVGGEGAWSSLSSARRIPKLTGSRPSRGGDTAHEPDGIPLQSDDSALSEIASPGKESTPESPRKAGATADAPPSPQSNGREVSPFSLKDQESDGSTGNQAEGASEGDEVRDAKNRPATMASSGSASKRPVISGNGAASVEESPVGQPSSRPEEGAADPVAPSALADEGKPGKRAGARSPANNTAGAKAPDASPESEAAAQNAGASAAGGSPAAISSRASSGKKAAERNKGLAAQGSGASKTDLALDFGAATDVSDDTVTAEEVTNKIASPSQPRQKPSPVALPVERAQQPNPAGGQEPATEADAAREAKKTTKTPVPAGAQKAGPGVSGDDDIPSQDESDSASAPTQGISAHDPVDSPSKNRSRKKSPAAASERTEGLREDSPEDPPALSAGGAGDRNSGNSAGPLMQVGRIRATAWKARLLRDAILPTRPVTAEEEDALESMREKILRQRALQMPGAFRQPRVRTGFALMIQDRSLHWRDDAGREPPGATVRGGRAELGWSDGAPPRNANYTLLDGNGRESARISFDQAGVPRLEMISAARASYWAAVEKAPADMFEWRLLKDRAVPASWGRDVHGSRVDIPLDATTARVGSYEIALVDPATGWALVGNVGFEMARGVSNPDF